MSDRRVVPDLKPLVRKPGETAKQFHTRYMDSDEWLQVRETFLTDVGNTCRCVVCGHSDVDLHHATYDRIGGLELVSDLVPLCAPHHDTCHSLEHFLVQRLSLARSTAITLATDWLVDNAYETVAADEVVKVWSDFVGCLERWRPSLVGLLEQPAAVTVEDDSCWLTLTVEVLVQAQHRPALELLATEDYDVLNRAMQAALGHGDVCVALRAADGDESKLLVDGHVGVPA